MPDSRLRDVIAPPGLLAARPAAGIPGRLYYATDGVLYRDTGTAWEVYSPSGGTITVREQDGSPSVSGVTTIEFATGTVVADQTGGVVRVTPPSGGGGSGLGSGYIVIRDEKAQGTNGGTFTAGAWRTRDLTTEVVDTGAHASVASNQITLAAGDYRCFIICPAHAINSHQARLQNITAGTTLVLGMTMMALAANNVSNTAVIIGRFSLAASSVLEVQHYASGTKSTDGFGPALNVTTEVYTIAEFWRE